MGAESVRGILAGIKTQTRRIVKGGPNVFHVDRLIGDWSLSRGFKGFDGDRAIFNLQTEVDDSRDFKVRCPYGGGLSPSLLWVREAFGIGYDDGNGGYSAIPWSGSTPERDGKVFYRATFKDHDPDGGRLPWRSPIHMPRWASRLTLRVEDVRVERLQDISEEDARAEGAPADLGDSTARDWFEWAWNRINPRTPFDASPWVWVVSFSRLDGGRPGKFFNEGERIACGCGASTALPSTLPTCDVEESDELSDFNAMARAMTPPRLRKCRFCIHREHIGMCTGRSGGTANVCPCTHYGA